MGREVPLQERARYRAFLSYSHRDAAIAARLHRRLERFSLPRRLAGAGDARLRPIFRDQEELPAADSLPAAIETALRQSAALLVLCSPAAAASPWVAREIATFRRLHPGRPVLAALVAGTPATAFPAALTAHGGEPLAADLTGGREARRLGVLRLVAGIAGVGLDDLVQRDAQARLRRVTAVTVAALIGLLAMTALAFVAVRSRDEAETQRAEAEGLVEFMLTDLRDRLRGVGRLDVMAAANRRALQHYRAQDLARLPAEALERRARILHAIGEDLMTAGQPAEAMTQFREAERTTAALLAEVPDDPDRLFTHAQSVYWVAAVARDAGRPTRAEPGLVEYDRLARRLLTLRPDDVRSLREAGYGAGNLCELKLKRKERAGLIAQCRRAVDFFAAATRKAPDDQSGWRALANRRAWLADAWRLTGDLEAAMAERQEQRRILERLLAADPKNQWLESDRIWCERAMAGLEAAAGHPAAAVARLSLAERSLETLVRQDGTNKFLTTELAAVRGQRASLQGSTAQ